MTYEIWDKLTPIYDITPEQAMKNNPKYRDEISYLFYYDDGSIMNIIPLSEIPNPHSLTNPDEICAAYIKTLTSPPEIEPEPELTEMQKEITKLKSQNSLLEDCIIELAQIVYA